MKKHTITHYAGAAVAGLMLALSACSDDKGNYSYTDKQVITIEGIPTETALLSGSEYIDLKPTVTSTIDGKIEAGNENYSFVYQQYTDNGWTEVADTKDFYQLATLSSGRHTFRFLATDNRTGVAGIQLFYIRATTVTSEGWIVLCNEGADERVRVDMLSQIDLERIVPTHDVVRLADDVPALHHATNLGFYSSQTKNRNIIMMMSEEGAYQLPTADEQGYTELGVVQSYNEIQQAMFGSPSGDHIVSFTPVPAYFNQPDHEAIICVSKEGNAYARNTRVTLGIFELPINTSTRGGDPEYKVAPFVGVTLKRPATSTSVGAALLFDTDNHRFVGWKGDDENSKQCCSPLDDPEDSARKFSFNTGHMDLVCMLNSAFSGGDVFCVMQDGDKRHLYVVNVETTDFKQSGAYLDIQAPDFDKATLFAASSQYPVIYYAYQNVVYAYNYSTGATQEALTLAAGEEVTMIKFNRFDHPWGVDFLCNQSTEKAEVYPARENRLIVGSYNSSATDDNGGILRFYDVSSTGMALTLYPGWEYDGYARIKDVVFKEIR